MRADGSSSNTIRVRLATVLAAGRHARTPIENLTREHVDAYLARDTIGQNSRASYYQHINSWYDFLVDQEELDVNPLTKRRRRPKPKRGLPRPLSDTLLKVIVETAPAEIRPAILLGWRQGLRSSEVVAVSGQMFRGGELHVVGKGDKLRVLPIDAEIAQLALNMPRLGWWFPSPHRHGEHLAVGTLRVKVSQHFRDCGAEGTMHRLRHTFATQLTEAGVDIRVIAELMGHDSVATTMIYSRVSRRALRDAVARLPRVSGL